MVQVGVLGMNQRVGDLSIREKWAKKCEQWMQQIYLSEPNPIPFVCLSTCNRTELYFPGHHLPSSLQGLINQWEEENNSLTPQPYLHMGWDCLAHLARVAGGLDSAILGETDIQRQVKLAYERTMRSTSLSKELHFLFQRALAIAKRMRARQQLARGTPRLEHAILQLGRTFFSSPEHTSILFIGASDINRKIVHFFQHKHFRSLTLCNRSEAPLYEWAHRYGTTPLPWSQLNQWPTYQWIIVGTSSPHYLIQSHEGFFSDRRLILDLSVPRNVDPQLAAQSGITLLNLDEIHCYLNRQQQEVSDSWIEAEEELLQAVRRQAHRYNVPPPAIPASLSA